MSDTTTISIADGAALSLRILQKAGLNQPQCEAVTDVMIRGQRDDCQSHGLYRLIACTQSLMSSRVNKTAMPS